MSRRRDKGAADVDFVKASGRIHEIFAKLARKGVPPDFWGSVLTDDEFAARVANALLSLVTKAPVSLEKLIADAVSCDALTDVNDNITSARFPETGVGGLLEEVTAARLGLSGFFSTQKVLDALDRLGYRAATMYEGVYHAGNFWGGTTTVGILGSIWRYSAGNHSVGCLWSHGVKRKLYLIDVGSDWNDEYRFLAVRKVQK